ETPVGHEPMTSAVHGLRDAEIGPGVNDPMLRRVDGKRTDAIPPVERGRDRLPPGAPVGAFEDVAPAAGIEDRGIRRIDGERGCTALGPARRRPARTVR